MPSEEDYAIRDRVFGRAMASANFMAEAFLQQAQFERDLDEHMNQETFQKQLEKNDGEAERNG